MKKLILILLLLPASLLPSRKNPKPEDVSQLDRYIDEAMSRQSPAPVNGGSPGSLWNSSALLSDLVRDFRASRVDDLVTIQVTEKADASSTGDTKTSRQSNVKSNVASVFGAAALKHPLANLANLSTANALQGQGATTRQTALTTTLSARVTNVLPNGYLVVEGHKDTMMNSE